VAAFGVAARVVAAVQWRHGGQWWLLTMADMTGQPWMTLSASNDKDAAVPLLLEVGAWQRRCWMAMEGISIWHWQVFTLSASVWQQQWTMATTVQLTVASDGGNKLWWCWWAGAFDCSDIVKLWWLVVAAVNAANDDDDNDSVGNNHNAGSIGDNDAATTMTSVAMTTTRWKLQQARPC
jgi:hypothetical protein